MSIVDCAVRTDQLQLRSTHPRRASYKLYTPATLFHDARIHTRISTHNKTRLFRLAPIPKIALCVGRVAPSGKGGVKRLVWGVRFVFSVSL